MHCGPVPAQNLSGGVYNYLKMTVACGEGLGGVIKGHSCYYSALSIVRLSQCTRRTCTMEIDLYLNVFVTLSHLY